MKEEKKELKKCSGKKNIMFAYGFIQLSSSAISALALASIALGLYSIKEESKLLNKCVTEVIQQGSSVSEAVSFCHGRGN